jgi:hypothetical protein
LENELVTKKDEPVEQDSWDFPPVPESDREFMTVTLKGGGNNSWIVFHFNGMDEAEATLADQDRLSELMDLAAKSEATFQRHVKTATGVTGPASKPASGGWKGKSSATSGSKFECEHGERDVKTGRSAKGDWKGYFCPEKVCDPVWG